MCEVWEAFDAEAVQRFYHRDVVGHHRAQTSKAEIPLDRRHFSPGELMSQMEKIS
jgi:hypothetical protein